MRTQSMLNGLSESSQSSSPLLALRRRVRRHAKPLIVLSVIAAAAVYHSSPSSNFAIPDSFNLPVSDYLPNAGESSSKVHHHPDPDHALWHGYLAGQLRNNRRDIVKEYGIKDDVPDEDVFDPLIRRNEAECEGWDISLPEDDETWRTCWRAKMWRQIDDFEVPHSMSKFPNTGESSTQALRRLKRCLTEPLPHILAPDDPEMSLAESEVGEIERIPCSQTATKVVLASWYFVAAAIGNMGASGEAVWMKAHIIKLRKMGYTFLWVDKYDDMVEVYRQLSDVVSLVWAFEDPSVTCHVDPRCIEWSEVRAYDEVDPELELDSDGRPVWEDGVPQVNGKSPRHKWWWSRAELDAIPVEERGIIPRWKLFTTTYWGAKPGRRGQHTLPEDGTYSYNPLGQDWTLVPFPYPNHTSYLPYSIEESCMTTDFVPYDQRKERFLILAKKTIFFTEWAVIPTDYWADQADTTGLEAFSVSQDDPRKPGEKGYAAPEGVNTVGRVGVQEFNNIIAESKVMLGIGQPSISPTPYYALCLGVPVVIPYYFEGQPVPPGWLAYEGGRSQHGPMAKIGPPYVYSYRAHNTTDLSLKLIEASQTKIDRFIPEDARLTRTVSDLDAILRFDWEGHAKVSAIKAQRWQTPANILPAALCYEGGICNPIKNGV